MELGIDPPKGVMLYGTAFKSAYHSYSPLTFLHSCLLGPPGTGKTLCARAVANRTEATFIRVIGSELVQKYVGEGARMVRSLFVSRDPTVFRCYVVLMLWIAFIGNGEK